MEPILSNLSVLEVTERCWTPPFLAPFVTNPKPQFKNLYDALNDTSRKLTLESVSIQNTSKLNRKVNNDIDYRIALTVRQSV